MSIKSVSLLVLALGCAAAAGVSGMRAYDVHKIREWQARRSAEPSAVIEIAHCEDMVGALLITQDGVIHLIERAEDVLPLERQVPANHQGRATVTEGCGIKT